MKMVAPRERQEGEELEINQWLGMPVRSAVVVVTSMFAERARLDSFLEWGDVRAESIDHCSERRDEVELKNGRLRF